MKEAYKILPVYSGDVSGVCSALFELGGMVVIHDPSGCNSTYNTHDEVRWYDQDSLIFLSGLTEMDAILGDDAKLVREVKAAALELNPKFIALTNSPIPFMNGTDLEAIAWQLEQETGIPSFYVPTNGMHDYVKGAGEALAKIVERFTVPDYLENGGMENGGMKNGGIKNGGMKEGQEERKPDNGKKKVNLLGVTPLDFARPGFVKGMKDAAETAGWELCSCFAMGDSLEKLTLAWKADLNLVVSSVGMKAAMLMQEMCNIPYITAEEFLSGLNMTGEITENVKSMTSSPAETEIVLVGEPITMQGLALRLKKETGAIVRVISTVEAEKNCLAADTRSALSEEEAEDILKNISDQKNKPSRNSGKDFLIIADPFYEKIAPDNSILYRLPHLAFSGRTYFGLEKYNG